MAILDYFIVDVFTATPLAGNPLAVVIDSVGLTDERMQSIAREFNLSETTFIQRRTADLERQEGVRVRIFTTEEELPFAGHPSLGTACVLRQNFPDTVNHDTAHGETIRLALNVGPVPVTFQPVTGASKATFAEMIQRDPEFAPKLDRAEVARLTGLSLDDLDPQLQPQIVSTGSAFAIVLLRSAEALTRLNVRQQESSLWLRSLGARWFYVLGPEIASAPGELIYRARMQFNGGEDPATGSAAGCAISYLVARGAVPSDQRIVVRQGVEMGRPSELFLSARSISGEVTDVRVAGSTVPVANGQLFLP